MTCLLMAAMLAATGLVDPDFTQGTTGWRVEVGSARASVEAGGVLSIAADAVEGFPRVVQAFEAAPGALYGAEAEARDGGITGGYGAYMTLEFLDADGKRIHFEQSSPALAGGAWTPLVARCVAPAGTAQGLYCLVLRGAGAAQFRAPALRELEPPPPAAAPAEVALAPGEALPGPFLGLGFEDDGWLANAENAAKGVTAEDIALVYDRVTWMRPALVRMFCWYRDFNPNGDWRTFDFTSDNMQSRYRALEVYQRIGAAVNITGVEWNMRAPWADPEGLARAVGELFTELITRRGFTCVKQWTLTNEPNTHFTQKGASFADYARLHALVAAEFAVRGLDITIVGSDDTNGGLPWFQACVAEPGYLDRAGIFASHFYLQRDSLRAMKYNIADRVGLLAGRRPFSIAEFGFQDARSGTLENPLMDEFEYALLAGAFAMNAMAQGTAGLTIWCLHEVFYPNNWYMNYGLFKFKDHGWRPRPVFYAWSLLMRHAPPGAPVRPVPGLPPTLAAVQAGDTIFFVNLADTPVRLVVTGAVEARVFTEAGLPGPEADEAAIRAAAEGRGVGLANSGFEAPARSFGMVR